MKFETPALSQNVKDQLPIDAVSYPRRMDTLAFLQGFVSHQWHGYVCVSHNHLTHRHYSFCMVAASDQGDFRSVGSTYSEIMILPSYILHFL